jgi:ACR3 family arsenite efflux pump ArsB
MSREQLEEKQIWIYAAALAIGAGLGLWRPAFGASLEFLISPVIGILLYEMFTQIPFLQLRGAFANRRFTAALLTVNFVVVPVLVWLLSRFLPDHPPLLIGVFLVLLTPCIDYVIVFTHLGRGNALLVLASTPLLLLAQNASFAHLSVAVHGGTSRTGHECGAVSGGFSCAHCFATRSCAGNRVLG